MMYGITWAYNTVLVYYTIPALEYWITLYLSYVNYWHDTFRVFSSLWIDKMNKNSGFYYYNNSSWNELSQSY
jgi:hypothetical protein